jgi:hypothetical protein
MTRRDFSVSLAGLAVSPGIVYGDSSTFVTLKAIAGARLPATLAIATTSPHRMREGLWELRAYRTFSQAGSRLLAERLNALFPGAGINPALQRGDRASLTYLIPFEDLAARDRAWTALTTNPAWTGMRFRSYHFSLYSVA